MGGLALLRCPGKAQEARLLLSLALLSDSHTNLEARQEEIHQRHQCYLHVKTEMWVQVSRSSTLHFYWPLGSISS